MSIEVTAAVIRNWRGHILIFRRAPGERLAGKWEFPGGKVEPGETLAECLERELREELKIETKAGEVLASATQGDIHLSALACEIVEGVPQMSVHDNVKALPLEELPSEDLAPIDAEIVRQLLGRA